MKKHALTLTALLGALALTAVGCSSGGDDGNNNTPDAAVVVTPDANNNPTPDAMVSASNVIGQPCTPDGSGGQGDCPAGHVCLNLQGGSGAWCSKECTGQTDPVCGQDYTGAGTPLCVFQVSDGMGGTKNFCAIICDDTGANVCPNCPATCPSPLMCTAELQSGGTTVAKACQ